MSIENVHLIEVNRTLLAKLRPAINSRYQADEIENETVIHVIRLRITSMSATSGPPIGPVLGQYGIPISKFCTESNERSTLYNSNVTLFVTLYHYADGNFAFDSYSPVTSMCFKRAACIDRCYNKKLDIKGGSLTPFMFFEAVMYKVQHNKKETINNYLEYLKHGLGTLRSMKISFISLDLCA